MKIASNRGAKDRPYPSTLALTATFSPMRQFRSDSDQGTVEAFQAVARGPIEPPAHAHLREGDRPFWASIVRARATVAWTDADLEIAANLARTKADIVRVQRDLDTEGDVVVNARGAPIMNPKHSILELLSRRALSYSRILHVHAQATNGRSGSQRGKLVAQRSAEEAAEAVSGLDDLIPGLRAHRERGAT